jgi:hypothetical protein
MIDASDARSQFQDAAVADCENQIRELEQDVRIIASIPGRYTIINSRGTEGNSHELSCRAVSISPRQVVLAGPKSGNVGEIVIAHLQRIGELQGPISRVLDGGVVLDIVATPNERVHLAVKLLWFEKYRHHEVPERRRYERIRPSVADSTLILPEGRTTKCIVVDMSVSGARITADCVPPISTPLAVGSIVGRVVRRFEGQFAFQFISVQPADRLEDLLIQPWRQSSDTAALRTG